MIVAMRAVVAVALAAAAFCSGCASTPDADETVRASRVYRTGSNLPVRDPSARSGVQTVVPDPMGVPPPGAPVVRSGG